jgi:hypothetical protein
MIMRQPKIALLAVDSTLSLVLVFCSARATTQALEVCAFAIEHELVLPGSCETIYDAITGDLSPWWDHTFCDSPVRFYLEPKPGGGFWEICGDSGDGVRHATVILGQRGKLLRFEGPLGLSGRALQMVHTHEFSPVGRDSTKLHVSVHACGEITEDLAQTVVKVWAHFLYERFRPHIPSGRHLDR